MKLPTPILKAMLVSVGIAAVMGACGTEPSQPGESQGGGQHVVPASEEHPVVHQSDSDSVDDEDLVVPPMESPDNCPTCGMG